MSGSATRRLSVAVIAFFTTAACGPLPRDPEKTLDRVLRKHHIRVGLVEHPPWVIRTAGEPQGVEVQLIREFATSLGATPDWFLGAQQPELEALESFQLDVVIAGLYSTTPWSKKIGLTRPYYQEEIVVAVPPGMQPPATLNGLRISVKNGSADAALVQKKGAVPVPVTALSNARGPTAGPAWRLQRLGFTLTRMELAERQHVMATPPGENGWLNRLGDFLQQHKSETGKLLQDSEAQP